MPKSIDRPHSRYTKEAAQLLGQLIRLGRIEQRLTTQELATRAGISRALLQRIEKGDLNCAIGSVFEAAAIVGVILFDTDKNKLPNLIARNAEILALLPKSVRKSNQGVDDDF